MSETSNEIAATESTSETPSNNGNASFIGHGDGSIKTRKLRFSVNPNLVDKSSDMRLSTTGWIEIEDTIDTLIEADVPPEISHRTV